MRIIKSCRSPLNKLNLEYTPIKPGKNLPDFYMRPKPKLWGPISKKAPIFIIPGKSIQVKGKSVRYWGDLEKWIFYKYTENKKTKNSN